MAVKFLREIVVSSLATALVTAVYTHGPDLKSIEALSTASPATTAALEGEDQRPEDLAQFMARVASGHVGKSSPRSPIAEAPASSAASSDSDPVWPPQDKGAAGRPTRAPASAKPAAAKPAATTSATETRPEPEPAAEAPPAQTEAAPSSSYATRIADKLKDYVWNPGASVVNGVSNGVSSVTNKITSFVKRQPS
ncbi:MAG TPA: hypothetical protein VMJ31_03565 [Methylocystis sp.]|nr:hypothetical protein [Methylocystis sp.]